MSPDDLRAAIETALRRRDPTARVWFYQRAGGRWPAGIEARCGDARMTVVAETDDAALRDLARLCGLRVTDDGVTDPAEEVERLRADLSAAEALAQQSADDAASVAVERDAAEAQLAEARAELARLRIENTSNLNVLGSTAEQLCDADRERSEFRAELARVTAERDALAKRFEQLRVSRYALEGQCRELHRALANRKARIARQRADAERFRVERNALRAERDALRAAVREYRDASVEAQAAMDEISRLVADRGSVDEVMAASRRGAAASARAYAALRTLVEAQIAVGESGGER